MTDEVVDRIVEQKYGTKFHDEVDSENEQHVIAVEFFVWADTEEQAKDKLRYALGRLEYDSAIEGDL